MKGLLILILVALLAVAGLWALRVRGSLLSLAAAALMFGGAGYALQGRPGLAGSPAKGSSASHYVDVAGARHMLMGQFTKSEHWMIIADSFAARGKTDEAVALVQSGLRAPVSYTHLTLPTICSV